MTCRRVLVLEAVTAGLFESDTSMRREGYAMLSAACDAILACGTDRVIVPTYRSNRLAATEWERTPADVEGGSAWTEVAVADDPSPRAMCPAPARLRPNRTLTREWQIDRWQDAADGCDAAYVIAPETGDVLASLLEDLHRGGVPTPGNCRTDVVRLFGDKLASYERLRGNGCVATATRDHLTDLPPAPRYVVKPRDGAGSGFRLRDRPGAGFGEVCQPWVEGLPLSHGVLVGDRATILFTTQQTIELKNGYGRYVGGRTAPRRMSLVGSLLPGQIDGIRGFVGVDFIQTDEGPVLIEVNPRLTTSAAVLLPRDGSVDLLQCHVSREPEPADVSWRIADFPDPWDETT